MDDFGVKLLLYFFGFLVLTCVGMSADSAITNYFRYRVIDRALTTMEIAIKAGVITKEDFTKEMNELASSLKKEKEK